MELSFGVGSIAQQSSTIFRCAPILLEVRTEFRTPLGVVLGIILFAIR
jgi:hypothetical protein